MTPVTSVPKDDWVLVPRVPTAQMLNRGAKFSLTLREAYMDMVDFAPEPPDSAIPAAYPQTNEGERLSRAYAMGQYWMDRTMAGDTKEATKVSERFRAMSAAQEDRG